MIAATPEPTEELFSVKLSEQEQAEFWKTTQTKEDCWEWSGSYYVVGYPCYKQKYAHRVAAALAFGPFPRSQFVCHKCDNRKCIRPDHLFFGTAQDNATDAAIKGRMMRGEKHVCAKLTPDDVRQMVELSKTTTQTELAKLFRINQTGVRDILIGRTWSHVTGIQLQAAPSKRGAARSGASCYAAKLSEEDAKEIRALKGTVTKKELAKRFGVKVGTIRKIHEGKTWKHLWNAQS